MKTLILSIAACLFSLTNNAQNTNVQSESVTTTTTVKDSDGVKKQVKTEKTQEVQEIKLKDAESNSLNKEMAPTPVKVTSTTEVTKNGVTKVVDRDYSAYYNMNGSKYQVSLDNSGYTVVSPNRKGVLRRTSNNNYIYRERKRTSYGYFDANGNLILETYDPKTDKITMETFNVIKN
ncbi:MAG: hypothetical protein V4548_07850 [Bacteroidota bacterium]